MQVMLKKAVAALLLASPTLAMAVGGWQEINLVNERLVNGNGAVINAQGQVLRDSAGRELVPDCAFGAADNGPYRFFFQQGDTNDLVVFHSGGGACWENNTCGSAILNRVFPSVRSTFYPKIIVNAERLNQAKGIFDVNDPNNPYAKASKIYIPYCTGDVGWGNRDASYAYPQAPGMPAGTYTLHHRGYANIRVVTEWLQRRIARFGQPGKVMVGGTSAGGYAVIGSLFPEVSKVVDLRRTKVSVIGDSANGVVTDDFLTVSRQSWGSEGTLPPHVRQVLAGGSQELSARMYLSSTLRYPGVRFSQYQNAFDLVQAQFLNIMRNVNSPSLWSDPNAVTQALAEWTVRMRANTLAAAVSPAYRFYTAAGYEHGVLDFVQASDGLGFCSDNFANEASANGAGGAVAASAWAGDMFSGQGYLWNTQKWQNATCAPNCNKPPVCVTN